MHQRSVTSANWWEKRNHAWERCPHLEKIHVPYWGISSPTGLIPFSESRLSNCTTGGYRYCDSYLLLERPHGAVAPPSDLLYSSNHFCVAAEDSGLCHIGLDAFSAEVLRKVDGVTFVTTHGTQRPVVALTVHGVEWPMTFPNPLLTQKVNGHLRGDPARLPADPYGSGWLFSVALDRISGHKSGIGRCVRGSRINVNLAVSGAGYSNRSGVRRW